MRPERAAAVIRRLERARPAIGNELIARIYTTGRVEDGEGRSFPLHSAIHPDYAEALYRTVLRHRPGLVVEIGMAFGLSSLAILTALREAGGGRLISIDPSQSTTWKGVGVANVRRAGFEEIHRLIESPDYEALPDLLREGVKADLAYVDGRHDIDHVLLDFFYLDRMLRTGGVIGFNDCGWPAVRKVLGFVRTHRHYAEIDVGLNPGIRAGKILFRKARWLLRRIDRYFVKLDDWKPSCNFYVRF